MACPSPPRDVIDYLISITPICVAAAVAVIAIWQSRINKNKLRLDLYNRRFDIYSRALAFYQALLTFEARGGSRSPEKLRFNELQKEFIRSFRESQFLFDKKHGVYDILDEMNTRSFRIIVYKEHGRELAQSDSEEFIKRSTENAEDLKWLNDSIPKLENAMARYLNFHGMAG